ncbi:hypothetical protein S40293_10552 [Stachybotrys chartarum IBT 40293]|nr:hypothetical protein S40293_10552 [Stachybotrys chartarum IBT 40293]
MNNIAEAAASTRGRESSPSHIYQTRLSCADCNFKGKTTEELVHHLDEGVCPIAVRQKRPARIQNLEDPEVSPVQVPDGKSVPIVAWIGTPDDRLEDDLSEAARALLDRTKKSPSIPASWDDWKQGDEFTVSQYLVGDVLRKLKLRKEDHMECMSKAVNMISSYHVLTKRNLSDWGSYKNISDNLMKIQSYKMLYPGYVFTLGGPAALALAVVLELKHLRRNKESGFFKRIDACKVMDLLTTAIYAFTNGQTAAILMVRDIPENMRTLMEQDVGGGSSTSLVMERAQRKALKEKLRHMAMNRDRLESANAVTDDGQDEMDHDQNLTLGSQDLTDAEDSGDDGSSSADEDIESQPIVDSHQLPGPDGVEEVPFIFPQTPYGGLLSRMAALPQDYVEADNTITFQNRKIVTRIDIMEEAQDLFDHLLQYGVDDEKLRRDVNHVFGGNNQWKVNLLSHDNKVKLWNWARLGQHELLLAELEKAMPNDKTSVTLHQPFVLKLPHRYQWNALADIAADLRILGGAMRESSETRLIISQLANKLTQANMWIQDVVSLAHQTTGAMIKADGLLQTLSKSKDHTTQPINSVPGNATSSESRPGNTILIEEDSAETSLGNSTQPVQANKKRKSLSGHTTDMETRDLMASLEFVHAMERLDMLAPVIPFSSDEPDDIFKLQESMDGEKFRLMIMGAVLFLSQYDVKPEHELAATMYLSTWIEQERKLQERIKLDKSTPLVWEKFP